MTVTDITWGRILRRFVEDLRDRRERVYIGYWLIAQLPGLTGNLLRSRYVGRRAKRAGKNLQVMAGCRFRSLENLEVGDNVNIGFDVFIQALGGLAIGDYTSLAPGVKIWTTVHNMDDPDVPMREQGQYDRAVVIGDDVLIGSNAYILPGAVIPRGCVIAPGSVVGPERYDPYSMLAGNPARLVGYRAGKLPPAKAKS